MLVKLAKHNPMNVKSYSKFSFRSGIQGLVFKDFSVAYCLSKCEPDRQACCARFKTKHGMTVSISRHGWFKKQAEKRA